MIHRLHVRRHRDIARLDVDLADAEADVDDAPLLPLGHRHAAYRVAVLEMVPDHRREELFRGHVVRRLLDPVLPVRRLVVAPARARYTSMPHHEEGEEHGHYLACVRRSAGRAPNGQRGRTKGVRVLGVVLDALHVWKTLLDDLVAGVVFLRDNGGESSVYQSSWRTHLERVLAIQRHHPHEDRAVCDDHVRGSPVRPRRLCGCRARRARTSVTRCAHVGSCGVNGDFAQLERCERRRRHRSGMVGEAKKIQGIIRQQ